MADVRKSGGPGPIRVGIGGWTFAPWRDNFYPAGLPHARELAYASRDLSAIEVNGTYYRSQTAESFRRWAAETPDDFVFALKASRYATNRKDLGEAGPAIERFLESGLTELGRKLGPILWQFAPTKVFAPDELERFLALLPSEQDGLALRHVLEVRHPSFVCAEFIAMARAHAVAVCLAVSDRYPLIADLTADFAYLRLQTSAATLPEGFDAAAIGLFANQAKSLAGGRVPPDFPTLAAAAPVRPRDCFVFFIGGAKERNPHAARALLAALG